jgi:hypothetical protein
MGFNTGVRTKTRNHSNRENFDPEVGFRRCARGNTNILQCRRHGSVRNNDKSAHAHVRCSGKWVKPERPDFKKEGDNFAISGLSSGWVWRKGSDKKWRPISSHYFWDNNYGADIVCRDLGYGKGVRTKTRNQNNHEQFDNEVGHRRCARGNSDILQCRKYGGPNQGDRSAHAHVKCSGKPWTPHYVRTGKEFRITREGWVERRARDGRWRPLTSHYFWDNNYGAQIVCRDMRYGSGVRTRTRNYNNRAAFDTETGNRRCASGNNSIL